MSQCKYCQEQFKNFDWIEIYTKDGRFWELDCPYCGKRNDLKTIEVFKPIKDYLEPQSVDIGTKTLLLKHLRPIAKQRGWKMSDLRKKSYWQLRAIYRNVKAD